MCQNVKTLPLPLWFAPYNLPDKSVRSVILLKFWIRGIFYLVSNPFWYVRKIIVDQLECKFTLQMKKGGLSWFSIAFSWRKFSTRASWSARRPTWRTWSGSCFTATWWSLLSLQSPASTSTTWPIIMNENWRMRIDLWQFRTHGWIPNSFVLFSDEHQEKVDMEAFINLDSFVCLCIVMQWQTWKSEPCRPLSLKDAQYFARNTIASYV